MSDFERLKNVIQRVTGADEHEHQTVIPLRGQVRDDQKLPQQARHWPDVQHGSEEQFGDEGTGSPHSLQAPGERQVALTRSSSVEKQKDRTVCPMCKGAGRLRRDVPFGHPDFGKDFACVCLERELREKRQRKMIALCEKFGFQRTQTLATFRHQVRGVQEAFQEAGCMIAHLQGWARLREAAKEAKDRPAPPREWLIFLGPVGTGKTHLAMAIANACLDAGIATLFATVPDLLDYLRATYSPGADVVYDELFEQMKTVEVLVLDDLGSQQSKPWADEKIFQLINHRYNTGWPTIFTLNKKGWLRLEERVRSRLQDASLVLTVSMESAQDYRQLRARSGGRRSARSMAEKGKDEG